MTLDMTPTTTLSTQLKTELRKRLFDDATELTLNSEFGVFSIDLAEVDSMSCLMLRISLNTDRLPGLKTNELQAMSDDLTQRLSYLLEPIRVIEIDGEEHEAQLRSSPPAKNSEATEYYELTVRATPTLCDALTLKRYRKKQGQPRESIPACVTHEVLERLANDFNEVVRNHAAPV